jgi:hypothetical protein
MFRKTTQQWTQKSRQHEKRGTNATHFPRKKILGVLPPNPRMGGFHLSTQLRYYYSFKEYNTCPKRYKYYSYIKVYGTTEAPHLLSYFLLDNFLMREIAYQTIMSGVTTLLKISNKNLWPIFPYPHQKLHYFQWPTCKERRRVHTRVNTTPRKA